MTSREEQLRLWKLKKHGHVRQENARPSELKRRRRSMSKAAQDSVAAKSKALQSESASSMAKQLKRQKKKRLVKPKARNSTALNAHSVGMKANKKDTNVLRALNSNKIHNMIVAQEKAGLGAKPVDLLKKANKRAPSSITVQDTEPPVKRTKVKASPNAQPEGPQPEAAASSSQANIPPFPQRTPLRSRRASTATVHTMNTPKTVLVIGPVIEGRSTESTPSQPAGMVRLSACATAKLQRTREKLEKPLAKLGPAAPKSARKPTGRESEGLTMREKLELWRAERDEKQRRQSAATLTTPGPKLSTLMLAAKARIKTEDWFGAENIFARIATSKVLRKEAFKKADYWVMRAFACEKLGRYETVISLFQQAPAHKPRPFAPVLKAFERFKDTYWQAMVGKDWPPMVDLDLSSDESGDEEVEAKEGAAREEVQNNPSSESALKPGPIPMDTSVEVMESRQKPNKIHTPVANTLKAEMNRALTMTGLRHRAGLATPVADALHSYLESQDEREGSPKHGLGHVGTPFANFLHCVQAGEVHTEWNKDSPPTKLEAKSKPQPLVRNLADAMQDSSMEQMEGNEEEDGSQDPLSLTIEMEEIKSSDAHLDDNSLTTPEDEDLIIELPNTAGKSKECDARSPQIPAVPEHEQITTDEVAAILEQSNQATALSAPGEQAEGVVSVEPVTEEEVAAMLESTRQEHTITKPSPLNIVKEVAPCLEPKPVAQPQASGSFIALQPVKSRVKKVDEKQNTATNWEYLLSPVRRSSRLQPRQNLSDVIQLLAATKYSYSPNPALGVQNASLSPIGEDGSQRQHASRKETKKICSKCLSSRAHHYTRHPTMGILCRTCLRDVQPKQRSDTPRPIKTVGKTQVPVEAEKKKEPKKQARSLPPVPLFDASASATTGANELDQKHTAAQRKKMKAQKKVLPPVPVFSAPVTRSSSPATKAAARQGTPIPSASRSRTRSTAEEMGIVSVKVAGSATPVRRSARNKRRRKN